MSHDPLSFLSLSNANQIEALYHAYLQNPALVDPSWRFFFAGMDFKGQEGGKEPLSGDLSSYCLIQAYRAFGHKAAHINPLVAKEKVDIPELRLTNFGLSPSDLDRVVATHGFLRESHVPLKTLIESLEACYCGTIGFDYMGLQSPELEDFIKKRVEPFAVQLSAEDKIALLHALNQSESFESFLHLKYPGQKRFSVEGGETIIPMLKRTLGVAARLGGKQAVLGMAHRGRLNVLANVMGKSYSSIFREFESHYIPDSFEGSGDVKYHKGFESKLSYGGKNLELILAANPSHLEAVDPVVLGMARAFQELGHKGCEKEVLPILIHGDASIAGQGIVYECLQMSQLEGYTNYGTLHFVINNQIGFTALPRESRSTHYCTDIARCFKAPVFHVNAEDPEACLAVCELATEIRFQFGIDVFIDLVCYRKYGHNESDEPAFTQPRAYEVIRQKKNVRDLYIDRLIEEKVLDTQGVESIRREFKETLDKALEETRQSAAKVAATHAVKPDLFAQIKSAVPIARLRDLARKMWTTPETVIVHPKLKKLFEQRLQTVEGAENVPQLDWGLAEGLAYASLLTEKVHVRISGQDSQRGTFTHRHGAIVDQMSQSKYFPMEHLEPGQAHMTILNSLLSEYGVLGFEFGYSMIYDKSLTIWEAQYGDFANGAQIIIDQFISSAEQKWGRSAPLTLFLPHGFEGQGPEHSSGRIERFLQLAANDCYFVCNVTQPAQLFHLLRRQAHSGIKKPLVVFTPKALLRYSASFSPLHALANGSFEEILDDPSHPHATRLLLCSGKVYYDLLLEREKRGAKECAIIRIEQLYPLHREKLKKIVDKYKKIDECMWVQEEHRNMGAWGYIEPELRELLGPIPLKRATREPCASPAAGSMALHTAQYEKLMKEVFYEG